jgi:hypothetical protein
MYCHDVEIVGIYADPLKRVSNVTTSDPARTSELGSGIVSNTKTASSVGEPTKMRESVAAIENAKPEWRVGSGFGMSNSKSPVTLSNK